MGDRDEPKSDSAGRLAHRMNNTVAYVLTNLNLLTETLEEAEPNEHNQHLSQLVAEATEGVTRLSDLIRELRTMSWGEVRTDRDESSDDTWDEERRPRRLLVVDDEPYILASVGRALRHYDVVTAEGGKQALDLLQHDGRFDLVICDLVMDEINGMDLHRWIATNRKDLLDRVIFMTAGAFTEAVRSFLSKVRSPVLHKPFDTKTLRWIIVQSLKHVPESTTSRPP